MKTEFECRFTDINKDEIRARLTAAGFAQVHPERMMRRMIFMLPEKFGARRWLRLRDEGDKTTLTLKLKGDLSAGAASMKEIECEVGDFELMGELLQAADNTLNAVEENLREKWTRGAAEACIDTWPGLNAFLEIESDSENSVKSISAELGFDYADAMFGNVMEVYMDKLGLTLPEVQACCTFANPPKRQIDQLANK